MLPDAVVSGVGAPGKAVPPVSTEYHCKFVPVPDKIAVKGTAVAFKQ